MGVRWLTIRNKISNFAASILCYVLMPLSPFFFEYLYTHPHKIATRSVVIALSTYSFTTAFSTKFRIISIILIVTGFLSGGMYGSVAADEDATTWCIPAIFLYGIILMSVLEWSWRHFFENEDCLFYTIFQKKVTI
jgi:hypothetical protein